MEQIINPKPEREEQNNKTTENDNSGAMLIFLVILAVIFLVDWLQNRNADTVNYTLYYRGIRVYDGICYEDRIEARMWEHTKKGKVFDEYIVSRCRPRDRARRIEKSLIKQFRPVYNVQHNWA